MKRFAAGMGLFIGIFLPLLWAPATFAASASISLSAGSSSATVGSYVTIYAYENSGSEPVNAAQVNFSYPSTLLQFLSINNSSAFSVVAQSSGGGGSVSIARGALPAVSGSQLVASVTFKALASSGTATLSVSGGSAIVSANSNANILSGSSGTSVTLKAPAPAPPAAPKDTTPPTISAISVQNITTNSVTVSWTTNEAATSEVDYGFSTQYGLTLVNSTLVTTHSIVLNSPLIVSATTYHFTVKSDDAAGNQAQGSDQTFMTKGVSLAVTVLMLKGGKPVQNARVSYNDISVTTDKDGNATLTNMPTGKVTLVITSGGTTAAETVVIGPETNGKPQTVSFKLAATNMPWSPWLIPIAVGAVILIAAIGFFTGRGGLPSITGVRPWYNAPTTHSQRSAHVASGPDSSGPVVITPADHGSSMSGPQHRTPS